MQEELKALQKHLGITFVFVTHDQGEALSMADRVAVFNDGKIVQVGEPADVYERPRSRFVADFVGPSNVLSPAFASGHGGAAKWTSLRPEKVCVFPLGAKVGEGQSHAEGEIKLISYQARSPASASPRATCGSAPRCLPPKQASSLATGAHLAEIGHGHHGGWRVSHAATAEDGVIADRRRDPRQDLRRLLRAAEAPHPPASAAAAPVDRHRLCRVAVRASAAKLLFARRLLRPDRPRVHALDLCPAP